MEYENTSHQETQLNPMECSFYDNNNSRVFGADLTNLSHLSTVSTKDSSDCYSNVNSPKNK